MGILTSTLITLFALIFSLKAQSFDLNSACGYPNSDAKELKQYKVLKSYGELSASESGDFSGAKLHLIKKGKTCQYSLEWAEGFPVSYLSQKHDCPKGSELPNQLKVFEIQSQWAMGSKKGELLSITTIKNGLHLEMSGIKMKAKEAKALSKRDQSDLSGKILETNHLRTCVQTYNKKYPNDTYLKYVISNSQNQINEKSKLPACKGQEIFKDFRTAKDPFRNQVINGLFSSSYNSDKGMQCLVNSYLKLPTRSQKVFLKFASSFFSKMDYYYPTGVSNYLYTLKKTSQVQKCIGKTNTKDCLFINDLLLPPKSFIQSAKKEAKKRKDQDSLKSINEVEKELNGFLG